VQGPFLRKYGVEAVIDFVLYETDGASLKTDASHASGDTTIMKDEGVEANTTNGFVDEGNGYSITLSATEMQAARVVVYVIDQTSPAVWLGDALVIDTYGNASAQHAFDLDDNGPNDDIYQAKVWLTDDDGNTYDRYVAVWFKNGEPVTSGITSPTVQIIKASDGTDLVGSQSMSQIASTGLYKYDENSNRISNGAAYIAKVEATIDGSTRTWYQPVSRDG